ncbi:MAG: GNAT family N-acetyltransferase [Anaerolineales bacterium]|nr:GNAT family N-acetyltransferase [Anaerolineales bacterium]
MRLETERLVVRSLVPGDLEAVHRLLDEAFDGGRRVGDPGALAERRSWLAWTALAEEWHARLHQPPYGERGVTLKITGELVGLVGYAPCLNAFGQIPELRGNGSGGGNTPEVGLFWAVAARHHRRGYATEAARALTAYAFESLRLRRIVATTESDNTASQGVMRKLGMHVLRNPLPEPPWLQVVGVLVNPTFKE